MKEYLQELREYLFILYMKDSCMNYSIISKSRKSIEKEMSNQKTYRAPERNCVARHGRTHVRH